MHTREPLSLFIVCLLLLAYVPVAGAGWLEPGSSAPASVGLVSADGQAWKASPPAADCTGPADAAGRAWTDLAFDDAAWTDLRLPDNNSIPAEQDRYYRLHYSLPVLSRTEIVLAADDSAWLYVNGQLAGQWGGECHAEAGAEGIRIDITAYLRAGENLIAVHVSNGPGDSWFDAGVSSAPVPPTPAPASASRSGMVTPGDSQVTVQVAYASGGCTGAMGLLAPYNVPIYTDYRAQLGVSFPIERRVSAGRELVFFWKPDAACGAGTFLSTDPARAQIEKIDRDTWIIHWRGGKETNAALQVDLAPAPGGFLDLPYDYRNSSFAAESRDPRQGGKVTATFDHEYPGSCDGTVRAKCKPWDTRAVSFYGYDGAPSDRPGSGYDVYYNGHSGTDYALGQGRPVLAAAAGTVSFAGQIATQCSDGHTRTANVVKIRHANGYTTEYWHLSSIAPGIVRGVYVIRDPAAPVGYVGSTGCASGPHLHFAVANPWGVLVDPYGWDPKPGSPYYGQPDPWQQLKAKSRLDGTSHYLWLHPLRAATVTGDPAGTLFYAASSTVRVAVPAGLAGSPVRLELTDALPSVHIPARQSLYVFALSAFDPTGVPLQAVDYEMGIDVRLPAGRVQTIPVGWTPKLQVWDAESGAWQDLATSWDPTSRIASAATARLGTFALTAQGYSLYLPAITRSAEPAIDEIPVDKEDR